MLYEDIFIFLSFQINKNLKNNTAREGREDPAFSDDIPRLCDLQAVLADSLRGCDFNYAVLLFFVCWCVSCMISERYHHLRVRKYIFQKC